MVDVSKLSQFSLNSNYPIDQVLYSFSTSAVLPTSTEGLFEEISWGDSFVEAGSSIPIPTDLLWIGRFSTDETNWLPFDGVIIEGNSYIAVGGYTDSSGNFGLLGQNQTGNSYTIFIDIVMVARTDQQPWQQPTYPFVDGFPTTGILYNDNYQYPLFDSRENYMKIALQGIDPITINTDSSYTALTIAHNLGFIPFAFLQMEYEGQIFNLSNATEAVGQLPVPAFSYIYMDETNIYVQCGGIASGGPYNDVTIHYKIYYDH
jgi:hypothetical protein